MTLYALLQGNIHKKIQCKSEYYFGWEKKSVITKIIKIIVIAYGGGAYAYQCHALEYLQW